MAPTRTKIVSISWLYAIFYLTLQLSGIDAGKISINFTKFNDSCSKLLTFVGDAQISENLIALTNGTKRNGKNVSSSVGRVVYKESIPLWDKSTEGEVMFTTHFQFLMKEGDHPHGEGLAFLFAPPEASGQIPIKAKSGGLGLFSHDKLSPRNDSSNHIVAVEFDTFENHWDKLQQQVGILVGTIVPKAMVSPNQPLNDGKIWDAWIEYNTQEKRLVVFLSNRSIPLLSYDIDLRAHLPENVVIGFSAAAYNSTENHQLITWSFSATSSAGRKHSSVLVMIVVPVSSVTATIICFVIFINFRKRRAWREVEEQMNRQCNVHGPRKFTHCELRAATKNFSEKQKIGRGGFGDVYKGILVKTNEIVAVKRISDGSKQGQKGYISEISTIGRLRHRNLVQLLGWCHEKGQLLLVYEYMANGSLDNFLFGQRKGELDWTRRYKISCDIASALFYLHELWDERVVHRDVKPSNVMLDSLFAAKLGDFGLARLVKHDKLSPMTSIGGTLGYMAPECATLGNTCAESDVFGFGAVALEIACGKRVVNCIWETDIMGLVEWVWDLYGRDRLLQAADCSLCGVFDKKEMTVLMMIGLWCSHPDPASRPKMRQVVQILNFEAPLPSLPHKLPQPTYSRVEDGLLIETVSITGCPPEISEEKTVFSTPVSADIQLV